MPKEMLNGINIFYEQKGEGFPLILIMGLSGNLDWWPDQLVDALAAHYQVIMFDNRGAGRSDVPVGNYDISLFSEDTLALMDALGIKKAHVMGVSMGGMIAQELTLRHPERVEKLILGCTNCGPGHSIPAGPEVLAALMRGSADTEGFLKTLFAPEYLRENPEKIQAFLRKYSMAPIKNEGFMGQIGAIMRFDSFDRLSEITAPVLVLAGGEDILIPAGNSDILVDNIPGAKLKVYPKCGHGFIDQVWQQVYQDLMTFL